MKGNSLFIILLWVWSEQNRMNHKVIIIGGGVAGLSAGIHARQSGFDVTILEQHSIPGGNCTSWKRDGYVFEGSMHWVTGSGGSKPLNKVWRNVGVIDNTTKMHFRHQYFTTDYHGQQVGFYRDLAKFHAHLLEISPEDKKQINSLCQEIKVFSAFGMPVTDIKGVKVKEKSKMDFSDIRAMMPALSKMKKYTKISAAEYASEFKNPAIRAFLENCLGAEMIAFNVLVTLGQLVSGDGYIEGGSLRIAQNMENKFKALGGEIHYNVQVERVIVDTYKGKVLGVLVKGQEMLCDAVIVTCDTITAVDTLFEEPLKDTWILEMKKNTEGRLMASTCVNLGIQADLSDVPYSVTYAMKEPLKYAGIESSVLGFFQYSEHSEYAPPGCTAMTVILMGDTYDYWKARKEDNTYETEKQQLAKEIINLLSEKLPRIKEKIVVVDVATPVTFERYCGTYRGAWMNWVHKGDKTSTVYPQVSEYVKSLYFAGQRIMTPGGGPVALYTGRQAVQYLCRDTETVFQGYM